MNSAQHDKDRSRGISRDMSPQAIARRLEIVSELREMAQFLGQAKRIDRKQPEVRILQHNSSQNSDDRGSR